MKLLHYNLRDRFIVTELHTRGTLDKNLDRYRGNTLAALQAFRPLVDGVREIHRRAIHRDIKPENIFLNSFGNLVLGDFGIVFFQTGGRVTTTFERVGSHFWMAPWAYKNERLASDEVGPSLDIFPLGKVLWSMISGRNGFAYWEYDRDENNLAKLFPDDAALPLVNRLLGKCVVREEKDCSLTAEQLGTEVDALIHAVRRLRLGQKPGDGDEWPCRMCGQGRYVTTRVTVSGYIGNTSDRAPFRAVACNKCGHVELFTGQPPM